MQEITEITQKRQITMPDIIQIYRCKHTYVKHNSYIPTTQYLFYNKCYKSYNIQQTIML